MHQQYLSVAAILAGALLAGGSAQAGAAGPAVLAKTASSPVYTMDLNRYRWKLPEFRMAGKEAYVIVRIENTHDHQLEVTMKCRTPDGPIPQMTGEHVIEPHEFMYMDTRRLRDPMQEGEGVRVRCVFRANSSAKVKTWIYDESIRTAGDGAGNTAGVRG